jgi:PAS domain S-box-containing protein
MITILTIAAGFCGAVLIGAFFWTQRLAARLKRDCELAIAAKAAEVQTCDAVTAQVETRYRALFDSVPVAIMVASLDGAILDLNRAAMRTFGYGTREEAMTMNMRLVYVNPAERDRRMAEHLNDSSERLSELLMRRKDGSTFTALTQTHIIRDAQGHPLHIEGFVTDISDFKKLEHTLAGVGRIVRTGRGGQGCDVTDRCAAARRRCQSVGGARIGRHPPHRQNHPRDARMSNTRPHYRGGCSRQIGCSNLAEWQGKLRNACWPSTSAAHMSKPGSLAGAKCANSNRAPR